MKNRAGHWIADGVMAALALLFMGAVTVFLVKGWNGFDGKIPHEYSFWGKPDINFAGYGDRTPLVINLVIGWLLTVVLTGLAYMPRLWHVGVRLSEEVKPAAHRWARHVLLSFALATSVYFGSYLLAAPEGKTLFVLLRLLLLLFMIASAALAVIKTIAAMKKEET